MVPVEPVTPAPPRPLRRRLLRQWWRDVTMLHWPVDPSLVQPHLPRGCRPDTLDGTSYVGLIGFHMVGLGFGVGPGLPYVGTFAETNVRLYTVDDDGRRGVWFASLDAQRALATLTARVALRLPYMWSSMRLRHDGDRLAYECRRRLPSPPAYGAMRVRTGAPIAEPSELEHFLTARWGLHVRWYGGRTLYLPNVHEPWPLHRAEVLDLEDGPVDGLLARAGFEVSGPPASVVASPGVRVSFGPGTFLR